MNQPINLIAFTGYGSTGKDEAAKSLTRRGYKRRCFGDIIKKQLDKEVKEKHGFSAFTEVPEEKAMIRDLLEQHGETHYDAIMKEFFDSLPAKCVNTRLCRVREAQEWIKLGGVIVCVVKPGVKPETQWAADRLAELQKAGVIWAYLHNDGDKKALVEKMNVLFNLDGEHEPEPKKPLPFTPGLAIRQPEVSSMAARVIQSGGGSQPANVPPMSQAPGNDEAPKDKEGFSDYVPDAV